MPESVGFNLEAEHEKTPVDITEQLRRFVMSENGDSSEMTKFLNDTYRRGEKKGTPLIIALSASEFPQGKEHIICNYLKALTEDSNFIISTTITGTADDYKHLLNSDCANALASGIKFERID